MSNVCMEIYCNKQIAKWKCPHCCRMELWGNRCLDHTLEFVDIRKINPHIEVNGLFLSFLCENCSPV